MAYDQLREIYLDEIDFDRAERSPLIIVRSWGYPTGLDDLLERFERKRKALRIQWYDEALARVQMNLGVAVVPEEYGSQERVTAFRISPETNYTRWTAICYNDSHGLGSTEAYWLTQFVREYLIRFEQKVRDGKPPALGDPEFESLCELWKSGMQLGRSWQEAAIREYPLRKSDGHREGIGGCTGQ